VGALRIIALLVATAALGACGTDEATGAATAGGTGGAHGHDGAAGDGGTVAASGGTAGSAAGAGSSATGGTSGAAGATSATCDLGTMYPGVEVIDPDAPVFQDGTWSQQEVVDAFAQAKAEGNTAYLGYRAARDYVQYLDCAFCACGCAPAIGHLSAIDCFKDMHGFT